MSLESRSKEQDKLKKLNDQLNKRYRQLKSDALNSTVAVSQEKIEKDDQLDTGFSSVIASLELYANYFQQEEPVLTGERNHFPFFASLNDALNLQSGISLAQAIAQPAYSQALLDAYKTLFAQPSLATFTPLRFYKKLRKLCGMINTDTQLQLELCKVFAYNKLSSNDTSSRKTRCLLSELISEITTN